MVPSLAPEYRKNYREAKKFSIRQYRRKYQLLAKYGLTLLDYYLMFEMQGQVCAICRTDVPVRGRAYDWFAVDHDHKTGKVRGLLCSQCNRGLGSFRDNQIFLATAVEYLQHSTE